MKKRYLSTLGSKRFFEAVRKQAVKNKKLSYEQAKVPSSTYYRWVSKSAVPEADALRISLDLGINPKDFLGARVEAESLIIQRRDTLEDLIQVYEFLQTKGYKDDMYLCILRMMMLLQQLFWEADMESLMSASKTKDEHKVNLILKSGMTGHLLYVRILPNKQGRPFMCVEKEERLIAGCTISTRNLRRMVRIIKNSFHKDAESYLELDQQALTLLEQEYGKKSNTIL